ncbi:unnamed protein product [Closterium sp. NIES-65]|nr:unnamed protein product [Closterium sp. NIES-65]
MAGSGEHGGGNPRNPAGRGEPAEQRRAENGCHADGECALGERGEAAGATVQAGSAHADRQRGEEPAAASSDAANGWLVLDGERKAAGSSGVAEAGRHRSSSLGDSPQQVDDEYAEPYQFAQSLVSLSHNPDSPVISNCATCGRHGPPGSCACAPLTPLRQRGAAAAGSGGRDYSDVPQLKSRGTADVQVAQSARIRVTTAVAAGGEAVQERGEKRMAQQQQQQQRALRFASSVDVRRIAAAGGSSDKLANGARAEGGESRAQQQVAQKAWAEGFDAIERGLVAAVKGFAIGAGLRGGLSLFSLLGRLRRRRARIASGDKDAAAAAGVWEGVVGVVREGVRYGMFVGTFAGSYCVLDEGIAAVGGHDKGFRLGGKNVLDEGIEAVGGQEKYLHGAHACMHALLALHPSHQPRHTITPVHSILSVPYALALPHRVTPHGPPPLRLSIPPLLSPRSPALSHTIALPAHTCLSRTRRWRALLAGAAAAPSLLLAGPNTRHTSLALYVLLRAVVLAVRCGIKSPSWGWLFRPLTWRHGDTLLMCISAAQILSVSPLSSLCPPSPPPHVPLPFLPCPPADLAPWRHTAHVHLLRLSDPVSPATPSPSALNSFCPHFPCFLFPLPSLPSTLRPPLPSLPSTLPPLSPPSPLLSLPSTLPPLAFPPLRLPSPPPSLPSALPPLCPPSPLPSLPSTLPPLYPPSPLPSLPSTLPPLCPPSSLPSLPSALPPLYPPSPLPSLTLYPPSPSTLPPPLPSLPSTLPPLYPPSPLPSLPSALPPLYPPSPLPSLPSTLPHPLPSLPLYPPSPSALPPLYPPSPSTLPPLCPPSPLPSRSLYPPSPSVVSAALSSHTACRPAPPPSPTPFVPCNPSPPSPPSPPYLPSPHCPPSPRSPPSPPSSPPPLPVRSTPPSSEWMLEPHSLPASLPTLSLSLSLSLSLCLMLPLSPPSSAWMLEPHSLPATYVSFLNKHGGKPPCVYQAMSQMALHGRVTPACSADLDKMLARRGGKGWRSGGKGGMKLPWTRVVPMHEASIPCDVSHMHAMLALHALPTMPTLPTVPAIPSMHTMPAMPTFSPHTSFLHPGGWCGWHFLSFLPAAYMRAVPVYVPVYLVSALLVHRSSLLRQPLSIALRTALGAARSSLFLSTYCGAAWCCSPSSPSPPPPFPPFPSALLSPVPLRPPSPPSLLPSSPPARFFPSCPFFSLLPSSPPPLLPAVFTILTTLLLVPPSGPPTPARLRIPASTHHSRLLLPIEFSLLCSRPPIPTSPFTHSPFHPYALARVCLKPLHMPCFLLPLLLCPAITCRPVPPRLLYAIYSLPSVPPNASHAAQCFPCRPMPPMPPNASHAAQCLPCRPMPPMPPNASHAAQCLPCCPMPPMPPNASHAAQCLPCRPMPPMAPIHPPRFWTCNIHQLVGKCTRATMAGGAVSVPCIEAGGEGGTEEGGGDSATSWSMLEFGCFEKGGVVEVLLEKKSHHMELALYCFLHAVPSSFICLASLPPLPSLTPPPSQFLCGLAVLLEKKSRRMELALYCFSRAIESFFICLASWGVLPPLSSLALFPALAKRYLSAKPAAGAPAAARGAGGAGTGSRATAGGCRGGGIVKESLSGVLPVAAAVLQPHALLDVALLAAAAGVIMQCYQSERDVFRSKYLNVLDWIFGVPKGQKAASELYRRRSPQVHALEHAKPRSLSLPAFSLPASAADAAAGGVASVQLTPCNAQLHVFQLLSYR